MDYLTLCQSICQRSVGSGSLANAAIVIRLDQEADGWAFLPLGSS
jgi:hypothetical protein